MVVSAATMARAEKHPGDTYEDILVRDTRPVPDHLRQHPRWDAGIEPIPAERFYSQDYFDREVRHLWPKIWQWACRHEDIPRVNDYVIYDNVGVSLIIVRTAPDEVKAFYNSCLHRARKLVTLNGSKAEFRCPFHGISWNTDGTFKDNPIGWDFPQWKSCQPNLPEARVESWGGFVFVNLDPNAPSLAEQLKPLADHFAPYEYEKRYTAVHIRKTVRANWKVNAEAFMESLHAVQTHPQIMPGIIDVNAQYDMLNDYVSRQFAAVGVASPALVPQPSEQEIVDYMVSGGRRRRTPLADTNSVLPEGMTARAFMADKTRRGLEAQTGRDFGHVSDAELLDALLYNMWPHLSFWAGYNPTLVYRWLPHGLSPEMSYFDTLILNPPKDGEPNPPPAPVIHLGPDDTYGIVEEVIGSLAGVLQQDMGNMAAVQEGLRASGTGVVNYSRYTEGRIRHMHQLIHKYIEDGEAQSG